MTSSSHELHIPYLQIVISLVCILVPVSVGLIIHHQWPRLAHVITRISAILTLLSIVTAAVLQKIRFGENILTSAKWTVWLLTCLLPSIGFVLGGGGAYIMGRMMRCRGDRDTQSGVKDVEMKDNAEENKELQDAAEGEDTEVTDIRPGYDGGEINRSMMGRAQIISISLETGCQNTVLAIAITSISFTGSALGEMMELLILFGIMFTVEASILVCVVRWRHIKSKVLQRVMR